jgi:hypothetical protein
MITASLSYLNDIKIKRTGGEKVHFVTGVLGTDR